MPLWKFIQEFNLDLAAVDQMLACNEIELYKKSGTLYIRERR